MTTPRALQNMTQQTVPDKIILFDTTLRDGQLSPNVCFSSDERVEIAGALESAGMDVIEVAFPGMYTEDIDSTREIIKQVRNASLCCLTRMSERDINIAADVLSLCVNPRLHVYLDAKHIRSLNEADTNREQTIAMVKAMVAYARNLVAEVEFSPQDATRMEFEALAAVTRAALEGGAKIVNFSDTAGVSKPEEISNLFFRIFKLVPELHDVVVSLHGHDHLRRSTENVLSAIRAGVRQVEGTINGIGPAGGNTDLVQVVEKLNEQTDTLGVFVQADIQQLQQLSNRIPKR